MNAKAPKPKLRCFVISPIGADGSPQRRHADMVLNAIIRPALPEYDVKRADDFGAPEMITDKMIEAIFDWELAVADLTFNNPNVFYEIGLRHMMAMPLIHIAVLEGTSLPFDVHGVGTIPFDPGLWQSHVAAREKIAKAAEIVMAKGYKVSNPVTAARGSIAFNKSADSKDMVIQQLMQEMAEVKQTVRELSVRNLLEPTPTYPAFHYNALTQPLPKVGLSGLLRGGPNWGGSANLSPTISSAGIPTDDKDT